MHETVSFQKQLPCGQCLHYNIYIYTWVHASWIEYNNWPTRCNLFSLLHFCRQLYMFRVLIPIIRTLYNCNYSFWYWLTGSTTICSRCWVGNDSVGRVCGADVAARQHRHRTHNLRSGSQDHHPFKNSVQKTICCNTTSNAPDGGRMYPKHVELRIH